MGLKLWLDDKRQAPLGWVWARSYDEAVEAEHNYEFEVMSLDHDLAPSHYHTAATDTHWRGGSYNGQPETGMDFIQYLERIQRWPPLIIIHSMNPYGARRMHEVACQYTSAIIQPYTGLER